MKPMVRLLILIGIIAMCSAGVAVARDEDTLIYGEYGSPTRLVPILANDSISIRLI